MAPTTKNIWWPARAHQQYRDTTPPPPPPSFKERIPDAPHTLKTKKIIGGGWAGGGSGVGTVGQARGVEEGLEE